VADNRFLEGKTAFVTGASMNLGAVTAQTWPNMAQPSPSTTWDRAGAGTPAGVTVRLWQPRLCHRR